MYAYMIDDCESIVLLRQRVQREKLMRSSWELSKKKKKKKIVSQWRIAYYVIGVQANYALAHSTLTIVRIGKKKVFRAFRSLDSFFRFRRECAERRDWGGRNNICC